MTYPVYICIIYIKAVLHKFRLNNITKKKKGFPVQYIIGAFVLLIFICWLLISALVYGISSVTDYFSGITRPALIQAVTPADVTVHYFYEIKADGPIHATLTCIDRKVSITGSYTPGHEWVWVQDAPLHESDYNNMRFVITSDDTNAVVHVSLRKLKKQTDFLGFTRYE